MRFQSFDFEELSAIFEDEADFDLCFLAIITFTVPRFVGLLQSILVLSLELSDELLVLVFQFLIRLVVNYYVIGLHSYVGRPFKFRVCRALAELEAVIHLLLHLHVVLRL